MKKMKKMVVRSRTPRVGWCVIDPNGMTGTKDED